MKYTINIPQTFKITNSILLEMVQKKLKEEIGDFKIGENGELLKYDRIGWKDYDYKPVNPNEYYPGFQERVQKAQTALKLLSEVLGESE